MGVLSMHSSLPVLTCSTKSTLDIYKYNYTMCVCVCVYILLNNHIILYLFMCQDSYELITEERNKQTINKRKYFGHHFQIKPKYNEEKIQTRENFFFFFFFFFLNF